MQTIVWKSRRLVNATLAGSSEEEDREEREGGEEEAVFLTGEKPRRGEGMAKMGRAKILEENKRTKTPSPSFFFFFFLSSRRISYFINSLPLCCEHSTSSSLSVSLSLFLPRRRFFPTLRPASFIVSVFSLFSDFSVSRFLAPLVFHSQFFDSRNDDFRDFRGWYMVRGQVRVWEPPLYSPKARGRCWILASFRDGTLTYRCTQKFNDIEIWIFYIPAKKERKYSKIQGILSSYPPQFSFRDRSKGEENSGWKPPTTNPSWKRKVVPKQGRERKEKKGLWEGGAVWNIVSLFANPDKSPSTGFLEVPRAYRSRASAHPRFLSALSFIGKNPSCPIPARRLCVWPPPPPLCFGPCATLDRRNVGIFRGQGRRGGCLNRARRGCTRGELGEFDFVSSF